MMVLQASVEPLAVCISTFPLQEIRASRAAESVFVDEDAPVSTTKVSALPLTAPATK